MINTNYAYNAKGQLNVRIDVENGQQERYTYDDQNRLSLWNISAGGTSTKTIRMNYDTSKGTIQTKSDVGYTFSYGANNNRSHVLTSINGKPSVISSLDQTIKYTSSKKLKEISEGNKKRTITYGIDNERCKEVVRNANGAISTRYFSGDYEEFYTSDNLVQKIHYLYAPEGLAGIIIYRERNTRSITPEPEYNEDYYVSHIDAQGSLVTLVKGEDMERYAYDPWGGRRNPSDWRAVDSRTQFIVDRGYCMHQHWDDFKLINMGARVYDPVFAQFLSPDPYIQAPDNWLNYNRYAYCLNNPLMYTVPTGEYFIIDDLILGAIGGLINLGVNIAHGNIKGNFFEKIGKGFVAFGAGALSGMTAEYGPAAWAATGMLTGGVNTWLAGGNMTDIFMGSFSGGVSGLFGGYSSRLGNKLGLELGGYLINGMKVSSPVLVGSLTGTAGGMAGGYAGNFLTALALTGDVEQAKSFGIEGLISGGIIGAVTGAGAGYSYAIKNHLNPWTGGAIGTYSVYQGVDANQSVKYVGITGRKPEVRFKEHLNSGTNRSTLDYEVISGTGHLSEQAARIMEQNLINKYGLQRNGGQLFNKINSISPRWWNYYGIK